MNRLFSFLISFMFSVCAVHAQMPTRSYITWDEFVQEYIGELSTEDEEPQIDAETLEWLEHLAQSPYQINRVERSELLQLPFLKESQVDSLISYRNAKHGILSLGELQLIRDFDYFTRRYLSLFVRCDSTLLLTPIQLEQQRERNRVLPKLIHGKHEVETTLDLPLYQRVGYQTPQKPTNANHYIGNALRHVLRYRYSYKRQIMYGFTMEKDAGEPVCKQGFYPYDYLSGYVYMRPSDKPWSFVVGDYNLRGARGLLFGNVTFGARSLQLQRLRPTLVTFKPHSSTEKSNFFRGIAASYTHRQVTTMLFASYRMLDARFKKASDTVQSMPSSGLHRTISEILARRQQGCFTAGTSVSYSQPHWHVALNADVVHYNNLVYPPVRYYNAHYFRGKTTGNVSTNYYVHHKKITLQGEIATDPHFHIATDHAFSYQWSRHWQSYVQHRQYSSRFVSIYGQGLQQAGRVANEQGVTLGTYYKPQGRFEVNAYVDLFRFPHPCYGAKYSNTKGLETMLQAQCAFNNATRMYLRYTFKNRQYTYTFKKHTYLEYRSVNRLRIAFDTNHRSYSFSTQLDGTCAYRQSGKTEWGGMYSARVSYVPATRWQLKGFYSLFFTDGYDARLYAYQPQLLHAHSFPSFAYHGTCAVVQVSYKILKNLQCSMRCVSVYYFNRATLSSRLDLINSPFKNDLSFQIRWII